MVELDFFQIFLPYSFRLIGPQTKHSQIQPWWVKIELKPKHWNYSNKEAQAFASLLIGSEISLYTPPPPRTPANTAETLPDAQREEWLREQREEAIIAVWVDGW